MSSHRPMLIPDLPVCIIPVLIVTIKGGLSLKNKIITYSSVHHALEDYI